ncbi:MAG: hypothetical protein E7484_01120 [Ruminococcaceae bacterium]|nr:hypothetical protein [Oscillospiraceae bacterium]
MHEAGHIIACIILGTKPRIELSVFGIKLIGYPRTKGKKFIVLISGPLINLAMVAISVFLLKINFSLNIYVFMVINYVILIFNCLPVFFLDGGQIVALFCADPMVRKTLDIISIAVFCVMTAVFSNNIYTSAAMVSLFIIYYFINKKTAF